MDCREVLDLLGKLVGIPSVFPNEHALSAFVQEYLLAHGYQVTIVTTEEDRPNIVATFGEAQSYLGFYGHLDSVPPHPRYDSDPFKLRIEGDIARGLGVADMKGGNACILSLAAWAAAQRLPVKIIFGVDEEDYSRGAHDLVSSGQLGNLAAMIVAESGQVADYSQPLSVGFGRLGRVLFRATVFGNPSHAAVASRASNAISLAAQVIEKLDAIEFPPHPCLGRTRIVFHNVAATTDSFSAPGECELQFSALLNPAATSAEVMSRITAAIEDLGIRATVAPAERPTPSGEAYAVDCEHVFVKEIVDPVLRERGIVPSYFSSVADENVFAHRLRIPVITAGPIGAGEHSAEEWVRISSLAETLRCYQDVLGRWSLATAGEGHSLLRRSF